MDLLGLGCHYTLQSLESSHSVVRRGHSLPSPGATHTSLQYVENTPQKNHPESILDVKHSFYRISKLLLYLRIYSIDSSFWKNSFVAAFGGNGSLGCVGSNTLATSIWAPTVECCNFEGLLDDEFPINLLSIKLIKRCKFTPPYILNCQGYTRGDDSAMCTGDIAHDKEKYPRDSPISRINIWIKSFGLVYINASTTIPPKSIGSCMYFKFQKTTIRYVEDIYCNFFVWNIFQNFQSAFFTHNVLTELKNSTPCKFYLC